MATDRKIRNFLKRWNISLDEQVEFEKFRNRIIKAVDTYVGTRYITNYAGMVQEFERIIGSEPTKLSSTSILDSTISDSFGQSFSNTSIYQAIAKSNNLSEIVFVVQSLFWVLHNQNYNRIDDLVEAIRECIKYSSLVDFRIAKNRNGIILYPSGAKLLDEAAVNEPLDWLDKYPDVAKHFEEALKIYLLKDSRKYRNLLDNLRFSLEQLLKTILSNEKSLENQNRTLLAWLKNKGSHPNLSNMYHTLVFGQYATYQNDAVKHSEKFSEPEIEFVIYLTGIFMRFILQLNSDSK